MNDQVLIFLFILACSTCIIFYRSSLEKFENSSQECEHYKLLAKYLTLILRKRDAEKELFRLEYGHARVYNSPRLERINKQIKMFKDRIKADPDTLTFFQENLDLTL
jgi:hypothetical protein